MWEGRCREAPPYPDCYSSYGWVNYGPYSTVSGTTVGQTIDDGTDFVHDCDDDCVDTSRIIGPRDDYLRYIVERVKPALVAIFFRWTKENFKYLWLDFGSSLKATDAINCVVICSLLYRFAGHVGTLSFPLCFWAGLFMGESLDNQAFEP